jgi:hypothetical protein
MHSNDGCLWKIYDDNDDDMMMCFGVSSNSLVPWRSCRSPFDGRITNIIFSIKLCFVNL